MMVGEGRRGKGMAQGASNQSRTMHEDRRWSTGGTLGALVVFADAQQRTFDLGDVRMLTMFAAQASVAIKNADLYQETRRRVAELGILTDIGRAISSTLDVPHLLDIVAEQTARVMYAEKLNLALNHPESDEIEFVLDTRPDMPRSGRRRRMTQGLTEYVIRTRQPLFLRGNVLRKMAELGIELIGIPVAAWIGVPLMVGERVLGVLCVQHYTDPDIYDESHVEVLQSVANQVAIALENARLFAETQRRVTELDTLTDIGRALSATLNVGTSVLC
jgi:GAF domain-containing protein